jgi:ATP-dependent Clp protease ATP-binding subunit ClpA
MTEFLIALVQALLDGSAVSLVSSITGADDRKLSPLDTELESLRATLAPHDLRLTVSHQAYDAIEDLGLVPKALHSYVQKHIRTPLAQIIQRGDVEAGQRIFVGWKDGVCLSIAADR